MNKKNADELDQYYSFESDGWEDASSVGYPESIGNFLIQFSSFENKIDQWVADGISDRSHHEGYHVLHLLNISNKIDLLESMTIFLLTNYKPEMRSEFKDIICRMRAINSFRNRIAHANWVSLTKSGNVHTKTFIDKEEGLVRFQKIKITPTIINQNIQEIGILIERLHDFFARLEE
jgi:hypothetical protein